MICALLVFQTPDLPAPLGELSPWLDWLVEPQDALFARLAGQDHRRFLKTHTSLDGVVIDPRATYIVVGRHPLDMAVSLYHQGANLDRDRMRELTGAPAPSEPPAPAAAAGGVAAALDRLGCRPPRVLGLAPGRGLARGRRMVPPARAERRAGALRRPVVRPRGRDAAAGRSPRHHRARGPLARAGAGGHVRRHASPGAAPGARPGRHHEGPRRVLPARDVGRRRRGPEPGGAGPLPRAGGRSRAARGRGLAPPRPPRRRRPGRTRGAPEPAGVS